MKDRLFLFVGAALWGCLVLASLPARAADIGKITIATTGSYAPWNFHKPTGELDGYDVDVGKLLCARMKAQCSFVDQDFSGLIPGVNAGKYDAFMAAINITPLRLQAVDFSIPYARTPSVFLVSKSGPLATLPHGGELFTLPNDAAGAQAAIDALKPMLQGKVFGALTSSTNAAFLDQYLKGVIELRLYQSNDTRDADFAAGRVDVIFDSIVAIDGIMKALGGQDLVVAGPRFAGGPLGAGVAVGFRKGNDTLKAAFDAALTSALADGSIKALSVKWFGTDVTPR